MAVNSYSDAGVDIEKGDRFARFIGSLPSKAVSGALGGFAGGLELDPAQWKNPLLLSSTDGVGTKLMVAAKLRRFDTIGIDLVAMCVNDLAVCGAWPLSFLDYIGCGRLNEDLMKEVISGIVTGCEEAECTLAGGETAEMPDMYRGDDFDLAGFCVGLVEKSQLLPRSRAMSAGDVIIGLPSSGVHSNGLSLARKVLPSSDKGLWRELLVPTRIYVKELKKLTAGGRILGAAHITGGGLAGNLQRILPDGLVPRFNKRWPVPPIFQSIREKGGISDGEMDKVFNMGIGIALIVKSDQADPLLASAAEAGIETHIIGELVRG